MASSSDPMAASRLARAQRVHSDVVPWLAPLAILTTEDIALRLFFRRISILGADHLPADGPVLLAPTHRARWDALILPKAAGRRVSGRDCRFMVTTTEMSGLQGWFLHRLGCFAIDQSKPGTASLRYALDLLADQQQVVLFPEGRINRDGAPITVAPGLPRLASLAQTKGLGSVPVIPIGIAYSRRLPRWGDCAALCFGPQLRLEGSGKAAALALAERIQKGMRSAEEAARSCIVAGENEA